MLRSLGDPKELNVSRVCLRCPAWTLVVMKMASLLHSQLGTGKFMAVVNEWPFWGEVEGQTYQKAQTANGTEEGSLFWAIRPQSFTMGF